MNPHDFIAVRYAELAGIAGDMGVKKAEAIEMIAAEFEASVVAGDLAVDIDYERLVRAELDTIDNTDRKHQEDRLSTARDALADETILGENDPILDQVCAIGGGVRKTYRHLTADDLLAIIQRKQQHAQDATAAATRVTDVVSDLLRAMRSASAYQLGELYG